MAFFQDFAINFIVFLCKLCYNILYKQIGFISRKDIYMKTFFKAYPNPIQCSIQFICESDTVRDDFPANSYELADVIFIISLATKFGGAPVPVDGPLRDELSSLKSTLSFCLKFGNQKNILNFIEFLSK